MSPEVQRIEYLLQQYIARRTSAAETTELFAWVGETTDDTLLRQHLLNLWNQQIEVESSAADFERIFTSIREALPAVQPASTPMRRLWPRFVAAAAVLLVLAIGALFLLHHRREKAPVATQTERFKNDVAPGGNKALLVLANGRQIILDSAHNGAIAMQGQTRILKLDGGQLRYSGSKDNPAAITYNTLSTPRGGQYILTLADGTKVWLDAASSIRYPTAFAGKKREVEITGQAYFEIARNPAMPFRVKLNNTAAIEVLGTAFNINAYANEESIRTTLIEGGVRVVSNGKTAQLRPGQEARFGGSDPITILPDADVRSAIAWKEGRFEFNSNIHDIMRQLERWYDVDVEYEGNLSDKGYGGVISRKENITGVLKLLELTGTIHFRIEGRKVTVLK